MLSLVREEFDVKDLQSQARKLIQAAGKKRVWLWRGEMGAGKTTLIKSVCKELGVVSNMASPTFSIVNEYNTLSSEKVFHFDFYRIKDESEAMDIGVEEYLDSGSYCFLEWPEKIPSLIDENFFSVHIFHQTASSRIIEYQIND